MLKTQSITAFLKKPGFVLVLILATFFLKGVFIATIFPIFSGQDETRHYNTIQYLAEPKEKTWPIQKDVKQTGGGGIAVNNFSEEIRGVGGLTDLSAYRKELFLKQMFTTSYDGKNEDIINQQIWKPYNELYPPNIADSGNSFYHLMVSYIEKIFSHKSILFRFFIERIFSVILGTLGILFVYLIVKNIGFESKNSLIMTAIISFQPKISTYFTNISYDALLIPLFFLFTLGGVLSIKNGINWKNVSLMLIAAILGPLTKGTGIILLGSFILLMVFHSYNFYKNTSDKKRVKKYFLVSLALVILAIIIFFKIYSLSTILPSSGDTKKSVADYLSTSLTVGRLGLSSRTYWGALDWTANDHLGAIINTIWVIEIISAIGLVWFFFSKKKPEYLPEKKYVIFLIAMVVALQLGIRYYDCKIFMERGSLDLGTPGRYFLPNIAAHIALVFTGLGMLLRKEKYFRASLIISFLLVFSYCLYMIFDVVMPRFYF
jgi:hypothetical protein